LAPFNLKKKHICPVVEKQNKYFYNFGRRKKNEPTNIFTRLFYKEIGNCDFNKLKSTNTDVENRKYIYTRFTPKESISVTSTIITTSKFCKYAINGIDKNFVLIGSEDGNIIVFDTEDIV
jgi:hypothetical protein